MSSRSSPTSGTACLETEGSSSWPSAILALFYLARGSNSLVVNTVAAMVLLTLVAYLIMHYTGRV